MHLLGHLLITQLLLLGFSAISDALNAGLEVVLGQLYRLGKVR
jgi:hypothetical protein